MSASSSNLCITVPFLLFVVTAASAPAAAQDSEPSPPAPEEPPPAPEPPPPPPPPAPEEPPPAPEEPPVAEPTEPPAATEPAKPSSGPAPGPPAAAATAAAAPLAAPVEDLAELDLESLLEVKSATKTATRAIEAPSVVTVIPRSVIEARGYQSVGEALASVPGIYVVNDLVTYNVGMRGVSGGPDSWSRIVKVLVDGMPVTFHSTGGTLLGPELIPMDAVEAIEVIRGPASALYGANAFLGAINIVTVQPQEGAHTRARVEGGVMRTNPSGAVGAVGSVASAQGSLLVSASAASLDRSGLAVPASSPLLSEHPGVSEGDRSRPLSAFLKGSWNAGAFGTYSVQALHQGLDAVGEFSDVGILTHGTRFAVANDILRLDVLNALWGEALVLRAFTSVTHGYTLPDEVLDDGSLSFTTFRARDNLSTLSGAELSSTFDDTGLLVGVDLAGERDSGDTLYQVRRDETRRGIPGGRALLVRGQQLSFANVGAYGQANTRFFERGAAIAGVRYDEHTLFGGALSGRLGVVWQLLDGLFLKGLYGSSYLPPAPTQLTSVPITTGGIKGARDLRNQTAQTAELALGWNPLPSLSVQGNGFFTFVADRIEFLDVGANLTASNLTNSQSVGGEAVVEWRPPPFFVQGNVSLQSTFVEAPDPTPSYWNIVFDPDSPGGYLPPGAPPLAAGHVTAGVTMPEWFFQASASAHAASERKATLSAIRAAGEAYTLPAYATFDLDVRTLGVQLLDGRETALSLHVKNVLDTPVVEGASLGVDLPSVGRTVFLRLSHEI